MSDAAMLAREFPDFDIATLPVIPDGFTCTAWHNDACPTWHEGDSIASPKQGDHMLAIDYADEALRECPGGERFNLHMYDGAGSPEFLVGSDDWALIEDAIDFARYVRLLGLGFHPDTRGADYVNRDGSRMFTDAEAERCENIIGGTALNVDPYEFGVKIWTLTGLLVRGEG